MTVYDFDERLAFSKALRQESDEATLRVLFPRCVSVVKTDTDMDRMGVDYIVTLRRGARLLVDAKARDAGCSYWWKPGCPEVALESWSVMPGEKYHVPKDRAKVGWTLDESKDVDLILFTFHPRDHQFAYVRPLPLLREAFRRNFTAWLAAYKTDIQDSRRWQSECVFVPLPIVDQAIAAVSRTQLVVPVQSVRGHDAALMSCVTCGEPSGWCSCDDVQDGLCPRCPQKVSWQSGTIDFSIPPGAF